jgi:hypothetical protein
VVGGGGADSILQFLLEMKVMGWSITERWSRGSELRKEAWHGAAAWRHWPKEMQHQRREREETTPVGLMQILLDQKMKKIHAVDSVAIIGQWRFRAVIS